jgi:hypothetical protein
MLIPNFNGGNDVGSHSALEMHFQPLLLRTDSTVLVIEPADKLGSAKTGRVNGEINLDTGERQTALLNQAAQYWGKGIGFEVPENRIVVGSLPDIPALMGLSQIAHESASRECAVDFEKGAEENVFNWQWWSSTFGVGASSGTPAQRSWSRV